MEWEFEGERYGFPADAELRLTLRTEAGACEPITTPVSFRGEIVAPGRKAVVWEVRLDGEK